MANIILTNSCNATCAFCFAQEHSKNPPQFLNLEDLMIRIKFLQASGQSQVRLIGGEPTLHPRFKEIIAVIISKDMSAVIFSNGYIPERYLHFLEEIPPEKIAFLININAQSRTPNPKAWRCNVFKSLNKKITLGFTILDPIFDLTTYYQIINTFNLQRKLRLGLAQPILFGDNRYLSPKLYKKAAQSILINATIAKDQHIQLEFDCGFVRCMFTKEEWQQLSDFGVITECHCAPNLDIDLDGRIFHCFSVSQIATFLSKNMTVAQAYTRLDNQRKIFRDSGVYSQCSECQERISGHCSGGCLSITMRRFHGLTLDNLQNYLSDAISD